MKALLTLLMIGGCSIMVPAQTPVDEAALVVKEKSVDNKQGQLSMALKVDISRLKISGDKSIVCTPIVESGDSVRAMDSFIINGKTRHILYNRLSRPAGEQEFRRMNGENQVIEYQSVTPYSDWMEEAEVSLVVDDCGCGWKALQSHKSPLFTLDFSAPVVLDPAVAYLMPQPEEIKARKLEGSAYLDFPVNQTTIHPQYRRNPQELGKIRETIEAVKNDPYTTITRVKIKGFASPEGAYASNAYLAENRAKALANYVKGLYSFGSIPFVVDFVPEDWAGLEKAVEEGSLPDKEELLAIIRADQPADYDQREWKLKTLNGGNSYRILLADVYPALRHSDYEVDYTIRNFSVEEAKSLAFSDPSKLSLNEFFHVAETYPAGSEEFNEIFETAVRMYPDDPVSNLNAAINAIQAKQFSKAERYLKKAHECPQKQLAKAALAMHKGQVAKAEQLLQSLNDPAVADEVQANLDQIHKYNKKYKK